MNIEYYVKKLKEHENKKLSTSDRNAFWRQYNENVRHR